MKRILFCLSILCLSYVAKGQRGAYNLYFTNPFRFNPSLMGQGSGSNIFAHIGNQFAGFQDGPLDQNLTFDHKFENKKFAAGGRVYSESAGILRNSGIELAYAYSIKLNSDWKLNLGLSGQIEQVAADINYAVVDDETELSLQQGWVSNGLFDAKFGSSFVKNDLIIGVSVPRIMQSTANLENDAFFDYLQYRRNRTFQLYLANKYSIGKQLQLWPSLLLSTQKQQTNIDFSAMAIISKNLIIGGGYHYKYGVSATVGLLMNNGLRLAYNFTMPGNEIGAVANGHEMALGYTFKLSKKETEKHKSPKSNVVQKSIEQQFLELDLENVVQKEALTRLKNQIKGTDIETTIDSIKTASKMLLESSNSNANYFLVYGSFSSLENASKYQQTLSRYSSKLSSKIIEDHGVFMVYLDNTRDQKTALEILKNKEEITLSAEEKWIYVRVD